jgi:CheY-like chemotaxis protein
MRAVAEEFRPQAELKGIRLVAVPTRLAVDTDPALSARILRNLVANAVRYTRTGGVVVGARRRGERVVVEVVDTGAGIAPEHRARVFEEFFQVRTRDAHDALAELARIERCPDLIVADLRLERDASGLDAVATLRHEVGARVPALVVSGDTSLSAARAVRSAGLALLPKPVVPEALAAAAAALIASGARA